MKLGGALVASLMLVLAPAAAQARPVARAAAAHDWTKVVAITPAGGFRMGNPAARVRLIEYGSLACPHCRHFEEDAFKPLLQGYVRTGKVSYEFRNMVLNAPDIAVSLLTRCAGPAKFFAMAQTVYATQPDWEKRLEAISAADRDAIDQMTDQQKLVRYAELGGLTDIAAQFGVTPARAGQCLADPKGLERLLGMSRAANAIGVTHTPTFAINGKIRSELATWDEVEPALKAALKG
jgi:protein-disulfide isomerase